MIKEYKRVDESTIDDFLKGYGPLKDVQYIRAIEANNWSNKVDIFTREPDAERSKKRTYTFRPFIYLKKLDFNSCFDHKHIEVSQSAHSPNFEYFIHEGTKYQVGVNCHFVQKNDINEKYIYKVNIDDINERKKYFTQKVEEYNIEIKQLKINEKVERLKNGYRFLFHINPPKKKNASSSNPLFKYRKNGKIQNIKGSYKDLLNFFAEGGLNVYERRGVFFSNEKVKEFESTTLIQDKFKFYFHTMDLFKKANPGIDIEGFFAKKPDFNYLLRIINKHFKKEVTDFLKDNSIDVIVQDEDVNTESRHIINNADEDGFLLKGDYGDLFLTTKFEANNYVNEYSFLSGYKKFNSNWKDIEEYITPYVNDLISFLKDKEYGRVVIGSEYKKIFGDKFYNFVLFLQESLLNVENNRKNTSKLSEARLADYIDIISIDRLLAKCNLDKINVEIDLDFVQDLNKNGRSDSFSFHTKTTGRKFIETCEYYGYDILDKVESNFFHFNTTTQFMMQTGARLFKGLEFSDLNILTLDIETKAQPDFEWDKRAALFPEKGWIFQIGISTTKGFSKVLHADNSEEELEIIEQSYEYIRELDPDIVLGYNSENFDWPYMEKRHQLLKGNESMDESLDDIRDLLYEEDLGVFKWNFYNKKNATLKVGGAIENYNQTSSYGKTFLDGWHNIKKLQAIDKRDSLSLKWNVKYEKINKPNRVYVPGDLIGDIGKDDREYYFCDENGDWFVNEIKIESQEAIFKTDKINRDENGLQYYGNRSKLYINTQNGPDNAVKGCLNVITFNGDIELFENSLYSSIKDFSSLVVPKKRFGIEYKGEKVYIEIINLLKRIAENFKSLSNVYSHLDFSKYEKVSGKYIVERYLLDDLWETVKLFEKTGQSSYMLGSWVMIGAQRVYTMGYASMWKIIITCWFYHNDLGVPDFEGYRKINGGLIGMFKAGYSRNVVKYDASSLYPSVKLAYLPAPAWDITGITDGLLNFFLSTRLKYKALKGKYYKEGDFEKSKLYGILEQPLKIFINSYYGFLGAWTVSPFSDTLTAHGITAISRQVARHMINWFEDKGFEAIYSHTDGINFIFPDNVDDFIYIGKGINWLVKKDKKYVGLEAYVAKYNDDHMEDRMGIDIDGIDYSCINIAKSNVVHLKLTKQGYEIDIVGGLIKKDTKKYIKNFLDKELKPLLLGGDIDYIRNYVDYLLKINNQNIKGVDIADFVKIKTLKEYETQYKTRMAVYELVKKKKIKYDPGSLFYYYNNGKQSYDFKEDKDKIGMFVVEQFNQQQVDALVNMLSSFQDRKMIKDKILAASQYELEIKNYSKPEKIENVKAFVFSKKRMSIHDMLEMGYKEMANYHSEHVEDENEVKSYEKSFYLDEIDEWDSIKIKKITHKNYGLCLEIYMVNDRLNITNLPLDEHDDKVNYNVSKYIEQFYKAIEPIHMVFDQRTRDLLLNIKNAIVRKSDKWIDHVNKIYNNNYQNLTNILNDIEVKMVNGVPLKGKEHNQQDKNKILDIEPIEHSYWYDSEMHPYWFMNKQKIDAEIFYINQEKEYICDKCDNPFAVCDKMGIIQHYSKRNFKAA